MVVISDKLPESIKEKAMTDLNNLFETGGAAPISFAQRGISGEAAGAGKTNEIPADLMASQRGVVV